MWSVLFVFSGYVVKHRCRVKSCDNHVNDTVDNDDFDFDAPWLNFTTPREDGDWSSCQIFKHTNHTLIGREKLSKFF